MNADNEFKKHIKCPSDTGKRLNYLIVVPFLTEDFSMQYLFPYGICMISAALKASGRHVFCLNLNYKPDWAARLKAFIKSNEINVVMTGALSAGFWNIKKILDIVDEADKDIVKIIGGGVHYS